MPLAWRERYSVSSASIYILIWLLLSFIGYMTLVAWTARLIFAIKLEQRMLARRARSIAVAFFLILLLAAVMTHFVGILGYFSPYMWLLMGGGTMLLMILWILDSSRGGGQASTTANTGVRR